MRSKADAIEALFGPAPHTELPPILLDWVPSQDLESFAHEKGYPTVTAMLAAGSDTFCSDPAYFDEVTHDAVTARTTRRSVRGRQA